MVLDEQAAPGSVIATDVSTQALRRTSEASYQSRELTGLSPARRDRHLTGGSGGDWEVRKELRDRVTVQHHNLITADAIVKVVTNSRQMEASNSTRSCRWHGRADPRRSRRGSRRTRIAGWH